MHSTLSSKSDCDTQTGCVSPRLVVRRKYSQMTTTNKLLIVKTEKRICRVQKLRMKYHLRRTFHMHRIYAKMRQKIMMLTVIRLTDLLEFNGNFDMNILCVYQKLHSENLDIISLLSSFYSLK